MTFISRKASIHSSQHPSLMTNTTSGTLKLVAPFSNTFLVKLLSTQKMTIKMMMFQTLKKRRLIKLLFTKILRIKLLKITHFLHYLMMTIITNTKNKSIWFDLISLTYEYLMPLRICVVPIHKTYKFWNVNLALTFLISFLKIKDFLHMEESDIPDVQEAAEKKEEPKPE